MYERSWLLRILAAAILGGLSVAVSAAVAQTGDPGACADCHDEHVASAQRGPHAALDRDPDLAALHGADFSCNGCHGDPTEHLDTTEPSAIFGFGDSTTAGERTARCLSCHATSHPRFYATSHAQVGLDCTSCHSVHGETSGPELLRVDPQAALSDLDRASSTCVGCHAQTLASFEFNERHRLHEGILGCADCHDPHAPSTRTMLGGFKQQACVGCHVDKAGPFVFEHGSVMVEGCVGCHEPHGGPNRHQLTFQSVADLCYSCHIGVPGFHSRFTAETVCTNCHSAIHGSNFHPAFLQ